MRVQNILSGVILGAAAFFSQTNALPVDTAVEGEHLEPRASTIAVTGVTGNGQQVRMELRTMQQQHPTLFNLYLLGLQSMMAVSQSNPISYYQLAGIHGRPYIAWDGVTSAAGSGGYGGGYCTHVSNLFLPWHRPYLALIEQTLYTHVQTVAASFPASSRATMVAAAKNFRMPYWDWAALPPTGGAAWPVLIGNGYTSVNTPTGQQTIVNPLYRYSFHPISASDMVYNPFAEWTVTLRDPTNFNSASAGSQDAGVGTQITAQASSYRQRLYNLFTNYSNFTQFGNEAWITSSTANADSLESLHDVLHSVLGSNGHMTYLDYAAFDPVFWLHHTMVDRCFALWQAIYPNSYVEPMAAVGSTYTYPQGTVESATSPLLPFHSNTAGGTYNSNQVKSVATFGYTYPELANGASVASIKAAIKTLYDPPSGATHSKRDLDYRTVGEAVARGLQNEARTPEAPTYQYNANIVSQKFALNGSYAIYVFFGEPSANPSDWMTDANMVGVQAVLANLGSYDPNNQNAQARVTGSVPLTGALNDLIGAGTLQSIDPEIVEAYLTASLNWRVGMFDGTEVEVTTVPDLSVTVVAQEVTPNSDPSEFPTFGAHTALTNVTSGRPGGHDDQYWAHHH